MKYFYPKFAKYHPEDLDGISVAPEEVGIVYEVNLKQAGMEHDFLYSLKANDPKTARKNADRYLRRLIVAECKKKHRPLLGYLVGETYFLGVRLFGQSHWNKGEAVPIESLPAYGYTVQEVKEIMAILDGRF
jgi:hypothetical protein